MLLQRLFVRAVCRGIVAVAAGLFAIVAGAPAVPAADQFPTDAQFARISLGHAVSDWFPTDIDGDGTWELAVRLAGPPSQVGVFDPATRTWIDGPRELAVAGTQWGAGDWNGDGALEYAYRSDRSVRYFDSRTQQDAVLWTVDYAPQDMVVWGEDGQGNPFVGLRERKTVSANDVYQESYAWHVYDMLTGGWTGSLPGGLGSVRRLYGFPTPEATCLAVHECTSWYSQVSMQGEEGRYTQSLHLVVSGWRRSSVSVLPGLNERMEMLRSVWGLRHAALIPAADGFGFGVAWYVLSLHGSGVSAPQYLGVSGGPGWSDQVADCHHGPPGGDIFAGLAVYDVTGDGRHNLVLPLLSGEGWEIREPGTGLIADTLRGMPSADLRAGALFRSGRRILFYVQDDALYVWDDGDLIDESGQVVGAGLPTLRAVPNPFNAAVTLTWSATTSPQALEIYNILGQRVRVFDVAGDGLSGTLSWDGLDQLGRSLASGVYLARLVGVSAPTVVKLVLLK